MRREGRTRTHGKARSTDGKGAQHLRHLRRVEGAGDAREQGNLDAIEALASPTSPTSQNSDEDTVTLDTTIALNSVRAENENEADAIETYADLEKTNSSHRLLCEECEKRPAVARCTACQETLCARCFVLTHPPRPGGNEHDDLRHGKVRA